MAKLQLYRDKLNLTQEELSERTGISVRTIQRIEAGQPPKGYTLKTLAKCLGVTETELSEKQETPESINIALIKAINLSSLPFACFPPINILSPLLLMLFKKQFNPLAKQIVTVQILWTIFAAIIFMTSAIVGKWFSLGSKFVLIIMILLALSNIFLILFNASKIDKYKSLGIRANFSLL